MEAVKAYGRTTYDELLKCTKIALVKKMKKALIPLMHVAELSKESGCLQ